MSKKSKKKYVQEAVAADVITWPKKPLSRLSDVYGHGLLADEKRRDVLIDLLNAVFEDKPSFVVKSSIKSVVLADRKPAPQHKKDKLCELDLICKTDQGTTVNIEFQTYVDRDFGIRLLMYIVSVMKQMKTAGLEYRDITPLVLVVFTDQDVAKMLGQTMADATPVWHRICGLGDFGHTGFRITEKLEIHFIEVQNCPKIQLKDMTRLEQWGAFFNRSHEEEFSGFDDPIFNKVREFDHMFITGEDHRRILEERTEMDLRSAYGRGRDEGKAEGLAEGKAEGLAEGLEKGEAKGLAKGLSKGVAKAHLEMALGMLKKGIGLDTISELTGLSHEALTALQTQRS